MHFWLTTHYPHHVADEAEWFIYVRSGFEEQVCEFSAGDRVAFYEVGKGPDRVGKPGRPKGIKGIKALATGMGPPQAATFQENYVDGTSSDFKLECPCKDHDFTHELPMGSLFTALNRKLNLLGLGGGSGFVQLSAEEFLRLEAAFLASS